MTIRPLSALAFFAAIAGLSPALPAATPAKPKPTSDAEIEHNIRARLSRSKISADKFEVHVRGGVATLQGHTDVLQHKGVATRLAKAAGAREVNNKIEVSQAAKDKAANNLTTGRRRAQVKRSEEVARSAPR